MLLRACLIRSLKRKESGGLELAQQRRPRLIKGRKSFATGAGLKLRF